MSELRLIYDRVDFLASELRVLIDLINVSDNSSLAEPLREALIDLDRGSNLIFNELYRVGRK